MKKGIVVTLGTLAFALAGMAGYAKAPVFSSIPDIVIGPEEDNVGQTVDLNFFRYVNALNILNYVSDDDSTTPDLRFVFLEPNTYEDISINDKHQLDLAGGGDPNDPSTWASREFTNQAGHPNRSFLLSFRDLVRSPDTGTPPFADPGPDGLLPWRDATGTLTGAADGRFLTLWVSDLDNQDSTGMVVFSLEGGSDDLSGAFTTIFSKGSLPTQWTYTNGAPTLPAATSGQTTSPGTISLTGGLTATGGVGTQSYDDKFFGRWQIQRDAIGATGFTTGRIPAQAGSLIYVARFTMSHNQAALATVPTIRLGVFNDTNVIQLQNSISSVNNADPAANPQLSGQNVQRVYTVVWSHNDQAPNVSQLKGIGALGGADLDRWSAFFDLLDSDNAQQGTWTMHEFDVLSMPRPADQTPDVNITDFSAAPWTNELATGGITFTISTLGITFVDPGTAATDPAAGNFLLRSRPNTVNWTADKLIRVNAYVSCPTTTDRQRFHRFRVRHRAFFGNIAQEFFINNNSAVISGLGYAYMPSARDDGDASPSRYETYIASYGGATAFLITNGGGQLQLALDQLHHIGDTGVRALATNTTVHQVTHELLAEPVLP